MANLASPQVGRQWQLRGSRALARLKKQDRTMQEWLPIKERNGFARHEGELRVFDAERRSATPTRGPLSASYVQPTHNAGRWPKGAVRSALPQQLAPQLATLTA